MEIILDVRGTCRPSDVVRCAVGAAHVMKSEQKPPGSACLNRCIAPCYPIISYHLPTDSEIYWTHILALYQLHRPLYVNLSPREKRKLKSRPRDSVPDSGII